MCHHQVLWRLQGYSGPIGAMESKRSLLMSQFTPFVLHVIYSGVFHKMQTTSNCSLDDKLLLQCVAGNKVEVQTYNSKRRKFN